MASEQQQHDSPAPIQALGFFSLPLELRLDIYEFTIFSNPEDGDPQPCSHRRMQAREISPLAVEKARLVNGQFGDEFATVYYKRRTVALLMDLGDMTYINCTTGALSGAAFPFRKDYCLIRKLDLSIYLDNSHPMICQWCYWQEAKTSEVRPLFQELCLGPEEGSEIRTRSWASLPSLKSLHLRFISEGHDDHYLARESQVARVVETFAQAMPAQAAMTMEFMTNQRRRNATAEQLFTQGHNTQQILETIGRPLWFQCDPAMKYGGRIQRWIDDGLTYFDIVPRAAQIQWELLRERGFAETEPREQRERVFRRRRGREFEIVVLEVWGRERLENWREQGRMLTDRFHEAMGAGRRAAREVAA